MSVELSGEPASVSTGGRRTLVNAVSFSRWPCLKIDASVVRTPVITKSLLALSAGGAQISTRAHSMNRLRCDDSMSGLVSRLTRQIAAASRVGPVSCR